MKTRLGFKLVRQKKNGEIGSLFINRKVALSLDVWMQAEEHRTKGYAFRPGWHVMTKPEAPHLSKKGRIWVQVQIQDWQEFVRPESQGGVWLLAQRMRILSRDSEEISQHQTHLQL